MWRNHLRCGFVMSGFFFFSTTIARHHHSNIPRVTFTQTCSNHVTQITFTTFSSTQHHHQARPVPCHSDTSHTVPMDKTFSVEDLLGIWKSGGSTSNLLAASNSFGLGCRSTSDEAFQEFLKQIPSTSNFASIMEQHPESLPPSLPMAIPPLELAPPSTSASPSGDIPRVTSLEFLRPFTAPKVAAVGSGVVPDAAPATEPTPVGVVVPSSLGLPPMPQVSVCPPALPPGYAVLPQGAPIMLAPAVIPPPLQPPGSVVPPPAPMSATGTASETPHDEESMKKAELRRARR